MLLISCLLWVVYSLQNMLGTLEKIVLHAQLKSQQNIHSLTFLDVIFLQDDCELARECGFNSSSIQPDQGKRLVPDQSLYLQIIACSYERCLYLCDIWFLTNSGRGRNGWLSPPGCAMFTVSVQIKLSSKLGQRIPFLQHLAALAIVEAVRTLPGYQVLSISYQLSGFVLFCFVSLLVSTSAETVLPGAQHTENKTH